MTPPNPCVVSVIVEKPGVDLELKRPNPTSKATVPSGPRPRSRRRFNALVKLVRRTHLYFGLLLVPFVLLYGATAILFNHPTWFNATSTTVATSSELFDGVSGFEASLVAEEVRRDLESQLGESVSVLEDPPPIFEGGFIFESRTDEERRRVRVHPVTLESTTQTTRLAPSPEDRVLPEKVEISVGDGIDALRQRVEDGTTLEAPVVRAAPDLRFHAAVGDELLVVTYDLRSHSIDERRVDEPRRVFDLRTFLMRLHVSRGYPSAPGVRTVWGTIVDVTAGLMIFWAISGVIMWWQMKSLRRLGGVVLVLGVGMAMFLTYGMYVALYL